MNKNDWGLTDKQLQVLSLMAEGYSRKGIAKELNIKLSTVQTHLMRIYQALGLYPADENIHQYTMAALTYLNERSK